MPLFRQFHGRQPAPAPWLLLLLGLLLPGCGQLPWQPQPGGRGSDGSGGPAAPGPAASPPAEQAPPLLSLADHPDLRRSAARIARCARQIGAATPLIKPADASNFGDRLVKDAWGRELPHRPQLIVLHETVSSLESTLAHFQRHHPDDNDQASYHRLVDRDGTVIQLVPDGNRAYGAGQSAFGDFALQSRPGRSPSINNVALHLSLVSPADGDGDGEAHSGYSDAQYRALAAQVLLWQATYGLPLSRLTTHAAVDRSRTRTDPRSFNWTRFIDAHTRAATTCGWQELTREL